MSDTVRYVIEYSPLEDAFIKVAIETDSQGVTTRRRIRKAENEEDYYRMLAEVRAGL